MASEPQPPPSPGQQSTRPVPAPPSPQFSLFSVEDDPPPASDPLNPSPPGAASAVATPAVTPAVAPVVQGPPYPASGYNPQHLPHAQSSKYPGIGVSTASAGRFGSGPPGSSTTPQHYPPPPKRYLVPHHQPQQSSTPLPQPQPQSQQYIPPRPGTDPFVLPGTQPEPQYQEQPPLQYGSTYITPVYPPQPPQQPLASYAPTYPTSSYSPQRPSQQVYLPYGATYTTPSYPPQPPQQHSSSPQYIPYQGNGNIPSVGRPPQATRPTTATPSRPAQPSTDATHTLTLTTQSGDASYRSHAARLWVQDGSSANSFSTINALSKYLHLFPEADNDQGCRAFRYGPECPASLLIPLFDSLDFSRFSQFPYGFSGNFSVKEEWGSGSCTCDRCNDGRPCGHYVLSKNFRFYLPLASTELSSLSSKVESSNGMTRISAGTSRYDFYSADWNIQYFRFRSRRSETTVFAHEALIFQSYELEAKAKGNPLEYIFTQLEVIIDGWNELLVASSQFLSSFRVEVLEERLNTDRSVVRNLVVAAQHWEEFRKVLHVQLQRIEFLENVHGDPRWVEGRENDFETLSFASHYLQKFKALDFRIQTELIQETDALIQRVTNLISIDEGYRSRDQNESIKRLTWITFIFLPLLFTSALFSMQIDIFSSPSPWRYYIYASLILMVIIFLSYALLKSRRRAVTMGKAIIAWPLVTLVQMMRGCLQFLKAKIPSDANIDLEKASKARETAKILKWAAGSGNLAVLRNLLQGTGDENEPSGAVDSGQALIMAIQNGHAEAAELLIQMNNGVTYQDSKGATPLHWAAKGGHSTICHALLANGAELNAKDTFSETALDWAMETGDELTINLLLGGDRKFTRMDTFNLQALHFSARSGDLKMVKWLRSKGSSLEMRDGKGQTVLFHAVKGGQQDIAKWLLKEGKANVQAIDKEGLTPLHVAAKIVDEKMVSLLINYGANVNALSNMHRTPLHMIADANVTTLHNRDKYGARVLALLCDHGANINARSKDGSLFTHRAAGCCVESTKLLEAASIRGASLDTPGPDGDTPAHCAARCGSQLSLKFLAKKSIDIINCRNAAGYTPLIVAAEAGKTTTMEYLLDQGASHSIADAQGRSLVELSIGWGDPAVISVLQARGAQYGDLVNDEHPIWAAVRDGRHSTVLEQLLIGGLSVEYSRNGVRLLQLALESGNADAATILLQHGAAVDVADKHGWTALHSAAFGGLVAPMLLVLQKVTEERAPRDKQGWTPLNIAAHYGFEQIEKLLDPEGKMDRFGPAEDPSRSSEPGSISFFNLSAATLVTTDLVEAPGDKAIQPSQPVQV